MLLNTKGLQPVCQLTGSLLRIQRLQCTASCRCSHSIWCPFYRRTATCAWD